MLACDRCKKLSARLYVFGDAVNESYECFDLCHDCAARLLNLVLHYKHGDNVVVNNPPIDELFEVNNGK